MVRRVILGCWRGFSLGLPLARTACQKTIRFTISTTHAHAHTRAHSRCVYMHMDMDPCLELNGRPGVEHTPSIPSSQHTVAVCVHQRDGEVVGREGRVVLVAGVRRKRQGEGERNWRGGCHREQAWRRICAPTAPSCHASAEAARASPATCRGTHLPAQPRAVSRAPPLRHPSCRPQIRRKPPCSQISRPRRPPPLQHWAPGLS